HLGIDCGTSNDYIDTFGIKWVGDGAYVQGRESHTAKNNQYSNLLSTLRVFKSKKKNYYNIPGFQETKRQNITVCLAQINLNQFPFISALEVWSLDSNFYNHIDSRHALILYQRFAFGSSNRISYPTDPYDRYWNPISGNGLVSVSNSASSVDVTQTKDEVPSAVMSNAVATLNTSSNFFVDTTALPSTREVPIYLNMYFTEVQDLNPSLDLRKFNVMVDDEVIDVVSPAYQTALETTYANIAASSNTQIVLAATSDSTLPPLISGLELFIITDPLSNSTTNTTDVEGLASLQERFPVLKDWSGDPCLPAQYPWDWVNCTNETNPRITSLLLSGYNLNGLLPNFSSLDALQTIFSGNPYLCNVTCPKPPSKHHIQKWLVGVLSSYLQWGIGASAANRKRRKPSPQIVMLEVIPSKKTAQKVVEEVTRIAMEQVTNAPEN
ncbi:Malectin-like domain, partial [Dillenia turbinata]